MHRLVRSLQVPEGLQRYRHGRDTWRNDLPDSKTRSAIWKQLQAMQKGLCAYCEADISDQNNRHIEHFRTRHQYPELTFRWANLFGSCKNKTSCGTHKDQSGAPYDYTDLIKPDKDDPDDYLLFGSDGSVSPRPDLAGEKLRRATETIRVLNLNGTLRHRRKMAIAGYLASLEQTMELALEYPNLVNIDDELANLLKDTEDLPFTTAIQHTLTNLIIRPATPIP